MSYPYDMDLFFGSEKATADSVSSAILSMGDASDGLPTTEEELTEMLESGKAFSVSQESFIVDLSTLEPDVLATLPANLAGLVTVVTGDQDTSEVVPVSYTTEGEGDQLVITLDSSFDGDNLTLVLKNIVEENGGE